MMRDYVLLDPLHPNGGVTILADERDCVFCKYCTDIWWDYTNLIYMIACERGHEPWNRPCKYFKERNKQ